MHQTLTAIAMAATLALPAVALAQATADFSGTSRVTPRGETTRKLVYKKG